MNFCVTFLFCLIVTAKHAFFAPAVLQAQQQEQDDSVWLEVKVIYWAGQKVHSGKKLWRSPDDLFGQPNTQVIIENNNKNFFEICWKDKTKYFRK